VVTVGHAGSKEVVKEDIDVSGTSIRKLVGF